MTTSLILGASGMIGQHLTQFLAAKGHKVIGADRDPILYEDLIKPDEFYITDLKEFENMEAMVTSDVDEVYHLAAEMGGAGYIFTGENDVDIMINSCAMTTNLIRCLPNSNIKKVFYSSSACVYPEHNQLDPLDTTCEETTCYPASPDSEYGWEKLFAERLFLAYGRKHPDVAVRIGRLHNVFGTHCSWNNGREKAPAALCRKVIQSNSKIIEMWGPGTQTRSFLYVEECCKAIDRLMNSNCDEPVNIGSEQRISIQDLVLLIADIAGKEITPVKRPGPLGVVGRTSDNNMIKRYLDWSPNEDLRGGLEKTYAWIKAEIDQGKNDGKRT